ncbi:MAG TPA: ABC transporter permease [Candidatus Baltobacteraceae bacterium]|nr:ABC transporter permease [Candidatus Baltobacteraceae bacterium]
MTRLLEYIGEAAAALWRNRTRSILTMLGMIIGTASIIAVFGISRGATSGIAATFSSFGELPIIAAVDSTQDYPAQAQMYYRDATQVRAELGGLADYVFPYDDRKWQVRYGDKRDYEDVQSDGDRFDTGALSEGRHIDLADVQSAAHVAILTPDVEKALFGNAPALGKEIRINGSSFIVIGVYSPLSGSFFNNNVGSNSVAVPYSAMHHLDPGPIDNLLVYPARASEADEVIAATKKALQHIHGAKAQYFIQNGAAQIQTFENVLAIIATGLAAIGGVALVVAGIGIMNIMLVSVTERTREIGIRKSIGASRNDIALQFLMEALLLSLAGGGTGMLLGLLFTIGGAQIISKTIGTVIIPYVLIVSLAIAFSGAVGMLFGMYPAWRAANMNPIEALRS